MNLPSQFIIFGMAVTGIVCIHFIGDTETALWLSLGLAASCWLTWACTVIALGRQVQPRVHVRYTKLDHISQKTAKQLSVPNLKRKARQDIRFIR